MRDRERHGHQNNKRELEGKEQGGSVRHQNTDGDNISQKTPLNVDITAICEMN